MDGGRPRALQALEELKRRLRERLASGAKVEVGVVKELTGLTRKHVIPLLEYLDRERVTRRAGADRSPTGAIVTFPLHSGSGQCST